MFWIHLYYLTLQLLSRFWCLASPLNDLSRNGQGIPELTPRRSLNFIILSIFLRVPANLTLEVSRVTAGFLSLGQPFKPIQGRGGEGVFFCTDHCPGIPPKILVFAPVAIIGGFDVILHGCKHLPGDRHCSFYQLLSSDSDSRVLSEAVVAKLSVALSFFCPFFFSCPLFPITLPADCSFVTGF